MVALFYSCLFYPKMAHENTSTMTESQIVQITMLELIFLIDIIINFFLLPVNDEGAVIQMSMKKVMAKYIKGTFAFDLF